MKYAFEMGSDVVKYIPSFIKIGSGFQKRHRQHGEIISLLSFFQKKESRLKQKERDRKEDIQQVLN
jgi:hypothetical protein